MTPKLLDHARQRCAEMGISTKVAKRIVQNPTCTYPGYVSQQGQERTVVYSDLYPKYLVVCTSDLTTVITVLWKSEDWMSREEANQAARGLLEEIFSGGA